MARMGLVCEKLESITANLSTSPIVKNLSDQNKIQTQMIQCSTSVDPKFNLTGAQVLKLTQALGYKRICEQNTKGA